MKIKLIYAPSLEQPHRFNRLVFPPLGIAQLKAFLSKHDFHAEIDDFNIKILHQQRMSKEEPFWSQSNIKEMMDYTKNDHSNEKIEESMTKILKTTEYKGYDIIGISSIEPYQEIPALVIAKKIKEETGIPIVLGGIMSQDPTIIQEHNFLDYVIYGEGETPLLGLVEHIEKGKSPFGVRQLIFNENREIIVNPPAFLQPSIKDVPAPDFEGLPLELYSYNPFGLITRAYSYLFNSNILNPDRKFNLLVLPYRFIKGCTHKCTICIDEYQTTEAKTSDVVSEELQNLSLKYKTKYFIFYNQHINISAKYLNDLCDCFINKNLDIRWAESAVPDSILTKAMLEKMRKAGCIRLNLGVESGSQRILNLIEKRTYAEEMENVLKWTDDAGIWTYVDFITGMPYESKEEFAQTIAFIKRNASHIDDYQCATFVARPPSSFNAHPEKYGIRLLENMEFNPRATGEYPYDEITGLVWEEKKKKNETMRETVYKTLEKHGPLDVFVPLPTLFYLYDSFPTKKHIRNWLRRNYKKYLEFGTKSMR
jgi:radical SAM superfamily enzyme YgiQ (UPF0313 family)